MKLGNSRGFWVPPGSSAKIAGLRIDGGMLYVGTGLPAIKRNWQDEIESSLIDPHLYIDWENPDLKGSSMIRAPSYRRISAAARAGYLEWLAAGRRQPDVSIGFVFLFFYGLERRILIDAQGAETARREVPILVKEVQELRDSYGSSQSFFYHSGCLLEAAQFLHEPVSIDQLVPPYERNVYGVPLTTQLVLGQLSKDGEPIPSEWALSWVVTSTDFRLRTPAKRCEDEFRALFGIRYASEFGDGLRIEPDGHRFDSRYFPASPSFGSATVTLFSDDVPAVTHLSKPKMQLQAFVDRVAKELDGYSRWIGKGGSRDDPRALALLPFSLADRQRSAGDLALIQLIERSLAQGNSAIIESTALIDVWPSRGKKRFSRLDSEMLTRRLAQLGYGLEPDARFGGPPLGKVKKTVVFRVGEANESGRPGHVASEEFWYAEALALVGAVVVNANPGADPGSLVTLMEGAGPVQALPRRERKRLLQHVRWLLEERIDLSGFSLKLNSLTAEESEFLRAFAVRLTELQGGLHPNQVTVLRKIYRVLGVEPNQVYSDLQNLMASDPPSADEPLLVVSALEGTTYTVPQLQGSGRNGEGHVALDQEKLKEAREQTEQVERTLAELLRDDGEQVASSSERANNSGGLSGLDAKHREFLKALAERETWNPEEVDDIATKLGLMPSGALEVLNEAALESCSEILVEVGETVEINQRIAGGLLE